MEWEKEYINKVKKMSDVLEYIKSDIRIVVGHAAGEPQYLLEELVKNSKDCSNVEIVHMISLNKSGYLNQHKKFRHNSFFAGSSTRGFINKGLADYTPSFFYKIPELFNENLPIDIALIQTSLPDKDGFVSLGISIDYTLEAARKAKVVIAQLNERMPYTLGDTKIHIKDIDVIIKKDEDILELLPAELGEKELKIGEYCSSLISDGDTLQLGIGAIPDAVLASLKNKKDLGIHSEMISDGVIDLINSGVINNTKKNTFKGISIVSFIMGSKKLYNFVHNNPLIQLYPVSYVNNPIEIGKNDNVVSINSAIQVDLMGQVNAETIGENQFSGTGGQVDFIRGASFSKNGKSIIVLPSTAKNGEISRIVCHLDKGSAVTTTRNDVDYIVTEYGIAKLKGKTLRERALELIKISHPKFKNELYSYYHKKFNLIGGGNEITR